MSVIIPEAVRASQKQWRAIERNPKDLSAPELFLVNDFDALKESYKTYNLFLSNTLKEKGHTPTDLKKLQLHLEYSEANLLPDTFEELLPRGSPLKVHLALNQQEMQSWLSPSLSPVRGRDFFTYQEISVTQFDKKEFDMAVQQFNSYLQEFRANKFDVNPIPFSVQCVQVPKVAYRALKRGKFDHHHGFEYNTKELNVTEIATKLVLMAGHTFALIINFGLEELSNIDNIQKFFFKKSEIPAPILKFLDSLPQLYSVNAAEQRYVLSKTLEDVYNVELDLKTFDLSTLAVVCGMKMSDYSLFSLSLVTLGTPVPSFAESMDNSWAKSLRNLHLKFIKLKCQALYNVYNVLMGCLIRNIFPDPDIVLSVTELSQPSFICWFAEFVGCALNNGEIHSDTHLKHTRAEMILSLDCSQNLFRLLGDIIPNSPVISCGGERYLHHARDSFINQYHVLKMISMPSYGREMPNLTRDLEPLIYGLMYNRDCFENSGLPSDVAGLQPNPFFEGSVYKLDLYEDNLLELRPQHSRNIVPAVLEWGRLNPGKIPELFSVLRRSDTNDLATFWIPKIRLYEGLSSIYFHLFNRKEVVADLEKSITLRRENVLTQYKDTEARRIMELQQHRVNLLHHNVNSSSSQRVGIHQKVHDVIPGNFYTRNRARAAARKVREARAKEEKGVAFVSRAEKKCMKHLAAIEKHDKRYVAKPVSSSASFHFDRLPEASAVRSCDYRSVFRAHDFEKPREPCDVRFKSGNDVIAFAKRVKARMGASNKQYQPY